VLVSPKGFDTFNKEITPAHFSRTMQVHTSKPNKRTQSYIPPAKCENIEDEDDIHGFRHNNLRISLENNTLEKKGGAGYLRMNSGLRTVQGPLPSKSETLAKKHATSYSIQVTLGDQDYIGLDVRGMPKMMGVENYFSQK